MNSLLPLRVLPALLTMLPTMPPRPFDGPVGSAAEEATRAATAKTAEPFILSEFCDGRKNMDVVLLARKV